jgi:hypothetical protein
LVQSYSGWKKEHGYVVRAIVDYAGRYEILPPDARLDLFFQANVPNAHGTVPTEINQYPAEGLRFLPSEF